MVRESSSGKLLLRGHRYTLSNGIVITRDAVKNSIFDAISEFEKIC